MPEDIYNLGRLDMGKLVSLARSAGITKDQLLRELESRGLTGFSTCENGRFTSICR